jgi:hypothetical protein
LDKEQVKNIRIFAVVEIATHPPPPHIDKAHGDERPREWKDGSPVIKAWSSLCVYS